MPHPLVILVFAPIIILIAYWCLVEFATRIMLDLDRVQFEPPYTFAIALVFCLATLLMSMIHIDYVINAVEEISCESSVGAGVE